MQLITNYKTNKLLPVASGSDKCLITLQGASKFALVIPAAMNGKTATFKILNTVTQTWITTTLTQVLATGLWVPSAAQLATLGLFDLIMMELDTAVASDCVLQVITST